MEKKKKSLFQEIEHEFTQGQINVKCPYSIQSVQELKINCALNEHATIQVKGILKEEEAEECIHRAGSNDGISVYGENAKGKKLLFDGVVTQVEMYCQNSVYYVEIQGKSWSSMLDYAEKNRSFQNKEMSYTDILDKVVSDHSDAMYTNKVPEAKKPTKQFVLQYKETDWEFCKRLATHFGTYLVADSLSKKPSFCFGLPKNKVEISTTAGIATTRKSGQYHKAVSDGAFVVEEQFVKYEVLSKERLEPGDKVYYDGSFMIVEESNFYLDKGFFRYSYVLGYEESLNLPLKKNEAIKGISLLGKVLEAQNQNVKMKLDIDKEQEANTACWFPYASQANNLFYCMPEVGTSISLYFSDSDENSAIAMNSVRKNGGSCSKTSDPNMKYMANPEGKEFKLGVDDIDFKAHEKLFMNMSSDNGVTMQSHNQFNVFTKQKLSLEAKELIKIFANTGNIIVGAKEASSLYLLGGPDGDTHIKAGSNLIYEGRKKEVFTERLNAEIAYEEKKFDWGKLACNVLIGLAAVAAVVAVVATGGAALVAMGAVASMASVGAVAIGAAISGTIAVGIMAASDIIRGEVSDAKDYALAGLKGAIEGAISGAVLGLPALEGAKLIVKMLVSGGVSFISDAIGQGLDILVNGGKYDWKQGLLSFGIGFLMPLGSELIRNGTRKILEKFGKKMPDWLVKAFCKLDGDPVDMISGNVIYDTTDFELPGPLPLQWRRIWCSASRIVGHLGHGTRYSYEVGLEILEEEYALAVYLQDGRVAIFPNIMVGEESFSYENRMLLRRKDNSYELLDPETGYLYILTPSKKGYLTYKLSMIKDTLGHKIEFFYNENGYLCRVLDSAGRELDVITNADGRILKVELKEETTKHVLVEYSYNPEQDLVTVTDALGADTCLTYRNHLMIKKVDRNKNAFYWEYDHYEDGAKAVRTWGDGGVLSLWMEYHDDEKYNAV